MRSIFASPVFIAIFAAVAAAVVAGMVSWTYFSHQRADLGGQERTKSFRPAVELGGDFTLVDHNGVRVTQADFADRNLLVYFGFTFCPDVCPTDIATMAAAVDDLKQRNPEAAKALKPVFISVDPDRDTSDVIKDYVSAFHPDIVGLTGSAEQIEAVAEAYRVFYQKRPLDDGSGEYLVDHTAFTYFVRPDGKVDTVFPHGAAPEELGKALSDLIDG